MKTVRAPPLAVSCPLTFYSPPTLYTLQKRDTLNVKRTLLCLCANLLLLVSLYECPAHAAPTYDASVTLVSPANGDSYGLVYPAYLYHVPISITNQSIKVSGAAPSSAITLSFEMVDEDGTTNGTSPLIALYTNSLTPFMTDANGNFQRNINGTSDSYSTTVDHSTGNYLVKVRSIIRDAGGNTQKNVSITANYGIWWAI